MKVSRFGQKIRRRSGISQLMVDMGEGLKAGEDVLMLGGGNPSHISQVDQAIRQCMNVILAKENAFERAVGDYDPPQGNKEFIEAICGLLRAECGWNIKPGNIALTAGSQSAFFILFNIFAGEFENGLKKKILLPLAPEYTGYSDVGFTDGLFLANKPDIEHIDEHTFKYHVDFDRLNVNEDIGAICISRPTNPTANVLTDAEVAKLDSITRAKDVPLIIDNAYGSPFPNIIFTEARPLWNENTIVCMSLSKFGLPATRTGIVIAREEIIEMVSEMNAVMSLCTSSIGAAIGTELIKTGELVRLSKNIIKPYYQDKAKWAVQKLCGLLEGIDFHIHKPEGAFFLWLWLPGLKITDSELYRRLKKRGVLIVPGHYFFPGLDDDWEHKQQCIRISYAQDTEKVEAGLKIISEEIKIAHK
jgi:valine--pyruvate aminotransferase